MSLFANKVHDLFSAMVCVVVGSAASFGRVLTKPALLTSTPVPTAALLSMPIAAVLLLTARTLLPCRLHGLQFKLKARHPCRELGHLFFKPHTLRNIADSATSAFATPPHLLPGLISSFLEQSLGGIVVSHLYVHQPHYIGQVPHAQWTMRRWKGACVEDIA